MAVTYKRAVKWIACNDDNEWLRDDDPTLSVTSTLVAEMWGKSEEQFRADLMLELRHIHPNSWHGKLPWENTPAER